MTLIQWINIVLTLFFPLMVGLTFWLFYFLVQRLALHQRGALEQFARMAVQTVEQQDTLPAQKKTLATGLVVSLFTSFKLPIPPQEAIDTAIEAAVYELNKKPGG